MSTTWFPQLASVRAAQPGLRWWAWIGVWFAWGLVLTMVVLDGLMWRVYDPQIVQWEWVYLFRFAGDLRLWLVVATAMVLIDRSAMRGLPWFDWLARGSLIIWSAALSGLAVTPIQLLVRRQRPIITDGEYVFRSFADQPFKAVGLGMPSGHAAVAAGACFMLCRLHPSAWPVWLVIALGCCMQRTLSGAHFASDTYVSMWLGAAVAAGVWHVHLRNIRRRAAQQR